MSAATQAVSRLATVMMVTALMAVPATAAPADDALFDTVASLDRAVFAAFNSCDQPGQLDRHAQYFAPDVEFYHDVDGVTWSRDAMIAGTRKNVCGKYRRELIAGSLRVFPIGTWGAMAQGSHRFCTLPSGPCEGLADFTIIWRHDAEAWVITRVLSYAHRPQP